MLQSLFFCSLHFTMLDDDDNLTNALPALRGRGNKSRPFNLNFFLPRLHSFQARSATTPKETRNGGRLNFTLFDSQIRLFIASHRGGGLQVRTNISPLKMPYLALRRGGRQGTLLLIVIVHSVL